MTDCPCHVSFHRSCRVKHGYQIALAELNLLGQKSTLQQEDCIALFLRCQCHKWAKTIPGFILRVGEFEQYCSNNYPNKYPDLAVLCPDK